MERDKLLNPIFLLSITLLLVNDFFLKAIFHNQLTGKLSDFTGLFAFPFFWSIIFPKRIKSIHLSTVIAFLFWKSGWSQPIIDFLNFFGLQTFRTIDYADYFALISVLASYAIFFKTNFTAPKSILFRLIALVSIFAFVATTQEKQKPTYEESFKSIDFQNQSTHRLTVIVNFKYSKAELAGDSSLDNEFNLIDTLNLAAGGYEIIRTPIFNGKKIKFPSGFKITIADSLGRIQKVYDKPLFLNAVDSNYNHRVDHENADYWSLKVGEKKPEQIRPFTIYGRWQTISSSKRTHTFEIRERYYYDVDPDSDLAKYAIKDSVITIFYPRLSVQGKILYVTKKELGIKWYDRKTLQYVKLYD